jgi:3-methylcrotonyl-CoA carboxylase beta subunit
VREVIATRDGSELDEFKRLYGQTLVCGFARICYPIGILAITASSFESALKAAHFIELASARHSLVFLRTSRGLWSAQIRGGGIAKDGAKW